MQTIKSTQFVKLRETIGEFLHVAYQWGSGRTTPKYSTWHIEFISSERI